jgi:hypothetical protein
MGMPQMSEEERLRMEQKGFDE